jgi:prepilin-type N-terminal cleavage/methylation domain-containing protein
MDQKEYAGLRAFTLLELSIVIVIIGLIIAGITSGQSLVKQAQLRSAAAEFTEIQQSLNTFILTYDAIPGDMINAFLYWGTDCADTDVNCNGDNSGSTNSVKEEWMFWKHMSLASVYPGSFSGTATDGTYGVGNCLVDSNIPVSAVSSSAAAKERRLR